VFIPERRLGERRHNDVSQLLATQGWATTAAGATSAPPSAPSPAEDQGSA
jgi:hypothetical protein